MGKKLNRIKVVVVERDIFLRQSRLNDKAVASAASMPIAQTGNGRH